MWYSRPFKLFVRELLRVSFSFWLSQDVQPGQPLFLWKRGGGGLGWELFSSFSFFGQYYMGVNSFSTKEASFLCLSTFQISESACRPGFHSGISVFSVDGGFSVFFFIWHRTLCGPSGYESFPARFLASFLPVQILRHSHGCLEFLGFYIASFRYRLHSSCVFSMGY